MGYLKHLVMLAGLMALSSCSTPGGGPTPGQQAVLASAAHRTTDAELQQQMAFMSRFQAMQAQGRVAQ